MKIWTRKKLGIILDNLLPSQLTFGLLHSLFNNDDYDINLFCDDITISPIPVNAGTFNISDCYGYRGPVIATSLKTAERLLHCPSPQKYFYIWDLEWFRMKQKAFAPLSNLYRNSKLTYITRNNDYKQLIESCWNTKVSFTIDNAEFLHNKEFMQYVTK